MDIVELHRRVMAVSTEAVAEVRAGDLERATPCAGWTVRRLLEHMVGQNHGFAAAAEGAGPDPALFADRRLGDDHAVEYRTSADRVTGAFAAADQGGTAWLPEITPNRPFPLRVAIRFHLIDYVVHAWDVARAVESTVTFDDEVLAEAVRVAEQVPDDDSRLREKAFFRPALPMPDDASPMDRVLLWLGRDPQWRP